jgi:sugar phosphate isomerase/epimerase
MTLPLAGCSFGWMHQAPLNDALEALAAHGFRSVELTTAPPHLYTPGATAAVRRELTQTLDRLGLTLVSVNPSFVDVNLISTNPGIRETSTRQMLDEIDLVADCGGAFVVIMPGHRHALAPAPDDSCAGLFDDALAVLLPRARERGVILALENSPYGYLGSSSDLLELVRRWNDPHLKITYDVANALAIEDPAAGVRAVGAELALAHVSDTWTSRWAHTSPGRGEVDFPAFARALNDIGFVGPTVYELVDGEPVEPRLPGDLATLRAAGWDPALRPQLEGVHA